MQPWTTVLKAQNQQIVLLKQSEGLRPLRHLLDSFLVNGTARMPRSRALSPEACALEHFQLSLLKQCAPLCLRLLLAYKDLGFPNATHAECAALAKLVGMAEQNRFICPLHHHATGGRFFFISAENIASAIDALGRKEKTVGIHPLQKLTGKRSAHGKSSGVHEPTQHIHPELWIFREHHGCFQAGGDDGQVLQLGEKRNKGKHGTAGVEKNYLAIGYQRRGFPGDGNLGLGFYLLPGLQGQYLVVSVNDNGSTICFMDESCMLQPRQITADRGFADEETLAQFCNGGGMMLTDKVQYGLLTIIGKPFGFNLLRKVGRV